MIYLLSELLDFLEKGMYENKATGALFEATNTIFSFWTECSRNECWNRTWCRCSVIALPLLRGISFPPLFNEPFLDLRDCWVAIDTEGEMDKKDKKENQLDKIDLNHVLLWFFSKVIFTNRCILIKRCTYICFHSYSTDDLRYLTMITNCVDYVCSYQPMIKHLEYLY